MIISSENLWTFQYEFLRRLAQEFGDQVEVIVYLRRQDQYVESMWNEVIKLGVVSDTVEEYFDFMLFEENDNHGLRYKARLREISSITGKDHLHVRLYETDILRKDGGIHNDFLRTIGIDPDSHERVRLKRTVNERISSVYTSTQTMKDTYLSGSDRMRMEKLFAGDNAYIAEEYLGKEPGQPLFEDNNWAIEQSVKPLTSNEETILRLFFEVCYNEERKNHVE